MSVNIHHFTINKGATFKKTALWTDAANLPIDLTGYAGRMHLRRNIDDVDPAVILTTENNKILLGGVEGTVLITLSPAETLSLSGTYVYDLELEKDGYVKRLFQGRITIDEEVTR